MPLNRKRGGHRTCGHLLSHELPQPSALVSIESLECRVFLAGCPGESAVSLAPQTALAGDVPAQLPLITMPATAAVGHGFMVGLKTDGRPSRAANSRARTMTVLHSSRNWVAEGQALTLSASVATVPAQFAKPTGLVLFKDGTTILGTVHLTDGQAAITISSLRQGEHQLTAIYKGSPRTNRSTSVLLSQRIRPATVVDLMVVYTPAALADTGSVDSMTGGIAQAVADTNLVLCNSHVPLSIRLVHTALTNYIESASLSDDLERLTSTDDGYMDGIHSLRDRYGADLVSLFDASGDLGGTAYTMADPHNPRNPEAGFSVIVAAQAAAPYYTLAHELAHNFGATHDRENSDTPGVFPYSYGYRFTAQGTVYHDVMAYEPGERIPFFSNPRLSFKGVPLGIPGVCDVARTLAKTAPIIAAYRATATRPNASPRRRYSE